MKIFMLQLEGMDGLEIPEELLPHLSKLKPINSKWNSDYRSKVYSYNLEGLSLIQIEVPEIPSEQVVEMSEVLAENNRLTRELEAMTAKAERLEAETKPSTSTDLTTF